MANQVELAKHLGMTPQSVSELVKNGIFTVKQGRSPIDLDVCRIEYINHLRKHAGHFKKAGNSGDMVEEATRLKKFQADKAELEVNQLRARLIPADLVLLKWSSEVTNASNLLSSMATRLAYRVLGLTDVNEIEAILKTGCHETLEELSSNGLPEEYAERVKSSAETLEAAE